MRNAADMWVSNVDKLTKEEELPVRLCNYVDVYKNDRITLRLDFMRATATTDEVRRFGLHPGDVLITKDSEDWKDIGVPSLVEEAAEDLVCGYHLAMLRPRTGLLDSSYLFRALQSPAVAHQFQVAANGVTRYGLSQEAIKSILFPIPPLTEQVGIVRFLDYIDRRIRRYIRAKQKLIKLLEEQRQAIIHRSVTQGVTPSSELKPSGAEWFGNIPNHWAVSRAKFLFREVDVRSTTGTETLLSLRMYQGLVPHNDVSNTSIPAMNLIGFKKVAPGQLVMNRMRAAIGLFGVATQAGLVSPDYAVFDPFGEINVNYYRHLFRGSLARAVFRQESKGLGTGSSGFMRLYTDRFGIIPLPVPSATEQNAIVAAIDREVATTDEAISRISIEVGLLQEYWARLISDAVTGKLDVRKAAVNLPDEVSEEEAILDDSDLLFEDDLEDSDSGLEISLEEVEA